MFGRAAVKVWSIALALLLGAAVACATKGLAQGVRATGITDQFEAKANERTRNKQATSPVPALAQSQQEPDVKPLLVLNAIDVSGATVLAKDEIHESYRAYLGKSVTKADLQSIANAITRLYRQRGYALTRAFVPVQDGSRGRVLVRVVEGYIDEVILDGWDPEKFGAEGLLQAVTSERPLRLFTLERCLLLLSDTPGVRVRDTVLEEKGEATGRFRLIVRLEAWRLFANVDLDNRGASGNGPLQSFMATALNSALVQGDSWTINYSTIPNAPRESTYLGAVLDFPLGIEGARIGVKASSSNIWSHGDSGSADSELQTQEFGLYASLVQFRTRRTSLRLTAFAGLRDAREVDTSATVYDDHIRAVSLTADYQLHDKYGGANYVMVTGRGGLPILGASEKGDVQLSNANAAGEFYKVFWGLTRYQSLWGPWSALLSTTGQLASSPLLQSEQFYLGGPLFGRAFTNGDLSGDSGIAGLLEVRFDQTHPFRALHGYQLYAFVDAGVVWDRGNNEQQSLSSYGAGIRLFLQDDLRANLELTLPIDGHAISDDNGAKVYFSLSKSFKGCAEIFCGGSGHDR